VANPKLENGYTRIAHELLEQITLADFSAAEYKIIFAIIRQTYGYQKKSAAISRAQLSKLCGIHIRTTAKTLNRLIEEKVIIEISSPNFKKSREISINKNYVEWEVKPPTGGEEAPGGRMASSPGGRMASSPGGRMASSTYNKDNFKDNYKNRGGKKPPSLKKINDFCQQNNIPSDVGKKFFDHYEAIGWVTTKGFDITATWDVKLLEWNRSEIPDRTPERRDAEHFACYDRELINKLINQD
jgi:phage replication O-like protein O